MQPKDSDVQDFHFHDVEAKTETTQENLYVLLEYTINEEFDFDRMAKEWF